jgi:transcriptional regulator with XRE-family HTH domain
MLTVGQLIKFARIKKKLNQDDIASKLNVSKNYISLVENNRKAPSINFLKKSAHLLDIPPILLLWEKMDLPIGKSKEERQINRQIKKMLQEAQQLFAQKTLGIKNEKEDASQD